MLESAAKAESDSSSLRQELVGLWLQVGSKRASLNTEVGEARGVIASMKEEIPEMPQAMKEHNAKKELSRLTAANEGPRARARPRYCRARAHAFLSSLQEAAEREPLQEAPPQRRRTKPQANRLVKTQNRTLAFGKSLLPSGEDNPN